MRNSELNAKWEGVENFQAENGYKSIRINSECIPKLFIGIDLNNKRCLLLFLPKNLSLKINKIDKDRLCLSFLPEKGILLVILKDSDFNDLFNDLVFSIYLKLKSIVQPFKAAKELITTFNKWSNFFENIKGKKLGDEQIQGLFGELFVLNGYLNQAYNNSFNSILASWRGLYDNTNDFIFDLKNIEVKTKKETIPYVKISSEFQLENESGKGLELLVITIKTDLGNGASLHDLIKETVEIIRTRNGDSEILYNALNQKGLTVENLKEYNNYRFIVVKTDLYNAAKDDFPKLVVSKIGEDLSGLKYKLRVTQLDHFLIEQKTY
jgi:hypothetical protein